MSYAGRAFESEDGKLLKRCVKCKKNKETSDYYTDKRSYDGFNSWCKECFKGPRDTSKARALALKRYGLTLGGFNDVFAAQGGRCAACGTSTPGKNVRWCCDHDHATGKFRSILCFRCNVTLGHCKDNPSTLRALADYLERF